MLNTGLFDATMGLIATMQQEGDRASMDFTAVNVLITCRVEPRNIQWFSRSSTPILLRERCICITRQKADEDSDSYLAAMRMLCQSFFIKLLTLDIFVSGCVRHPRRKGC